MSLLGTSAGFFLILIGFSAQYLIKKRLQDKKLRTVYMWIAWVFTLLGGEAISHTVGNSVGVTSAGAIAVSLVGLLVVAADVKDKRPDWPAVILVAILPWFMRLSGGGFGTVFAAILTPVQAINGSISGWLGF